MCIHTRLLFLKAKFFVYLQDFDPTLLKKKKKKKTTFAMDLGLDDAVSKPEDNAEAEAADDVNDLEDNLDLESFGKKKKKGKKKKPFNLDEMEGALPTDNADDGVTMGEDAENDDINLDMDFSKDKKKKKSKSKKDLDELFADKEDDKMGDKENGELCWLGNVVVLWIKFISSLLSKQNHARKSGLTDYISNFTTPIKLENATNFFLKN